MEDLFKNYTRTQKKTMVQLTKENAEELAKFFGWSVKYLQGGDIAGISSGNGYGISFGTWFTPEGNTVTDTKDWIEDNE